MKIILLVLTLALTTTSVFAQNAAERPLITVTGQAEIMVVPDEAVFTMRETTIDRDLQNARRRNDEVVKKILALAKKYGVPPTLVQTDRISLEEDYSDENVTKKPRVFLGYIVRKSIVIILRDVSKAESLLADIFTTGITGIEAVDFRTTEARKFKDQARGQAIKAAQEKASALAREIGQAIGKAYSISEDEPYQGNSASNSMNFSASRAGRAYSADESTIALGQISITARVTVRFELK